MHVDSFSSDLLDSHGFFLARGGCMHRVFLLCTSLSIALPLFLSEFC